MIAIGAAWLGCLLDNSGAAELYYTNRTFHKVEFNVILQTNMFRLFTDSGRLTGIVKGTNITINTNSSYGIDRQVINLGYASASDAWNAVNSDNSLEQITPPGIFDQAGWIRGTKSTVTGEWGSYLWTRQYRIVFKASETNWYRSSSNGIPVAITNVYVGSLGDFPPMVEGLEDIGPSLALSTNFPGADTGEDRSFYVDLTNVYYQLFIPAVRITPRYMSVCVGGSNVQYDVKGTNIPQGVSWSITTNGTSGEAALSGTTNSAVVTPGTVATNYTIRASSIQNTNYFDEVTLYVVKVDKLIYTMLEEDSWTNMPEPPGKVVMWASPWMMVTAVKTPTNAPWPAGKPVWTGMSQTDGDEAKFIPTVTGVFTTSVECGNTVTGLVGVFSAEIKRATNGGEYESITDANRNVLPGQGMNFKLVVSGFEGAEQYASNFSWTVSGKTFKDYNPTNGDASIFVTNTAADFSAQTNHFYWADTGDGHAIQCQFTMDGQTNVAWAIINVKKPVCDMNVLAFGATCVTNYSQGSNIYTLFGLFGPTLPLISKGIEFTGRVQMPSGFDSGIWFFSQVIIPGRWREEENGENPQRLEWNGFNCRDGAYLYIGPENTTGINTNTVSDAPSITLAINGESDPWVKRIANESFKTYIMFRPPGTDKKDIPLKYVSWSWSGVVETNGASGWNLSSPDQANSPPVETSEHPVWTHIVTPNYVSE